MCIGKCHWRVYSSFSTCNSAVHWHHSRYPAGTSAKSYPWMALRESKHVQSTFFRL